MKDIGEMDYRMDLVELSHKMEIIMKVHLQMEEQMVKDNIFLEIIVMKVIGKMI